MIFGYVSVLIVQKYPPSKSSFSSMGQRKVALRCKWYASSARSARKKCEHLGRVLMVMRAESDVFASFCTKNGPIVMFSGAFSCQKWSESCSGSTFPCNDANCTKSFFQGFVDPPPLKIQIIFWQIWGGGGIFKGEKA